LKHKNAFKLLFEQVLKAGTFSNTRNRSREQTGAEDVRDP
jgi:hypothetical protein